jgi:hypothetical protein
MNLDIQSPSIDLANKVLQNVAIAAKIAVEKSTGEGTESGGPGFICIAHSNFVDVTSFLLG